MSKFQALLVSEDSPGHFLPEVVERIKLLGGQVVTSPPEVPKSSV